MFEEPSLAPVCVNVCESEYLRWKKKSGYSYEPARKISCIRA